MRDDEGRRWQPVYVLPRSPETDAMLIEQGAKAMWFVVSGEPWSKVGQYMRDTYHGYARAVLRGAGLTKK